MRLSCNALTNDHYWYIAIHSHGNALTHTNLQKCIPNYWEFDEVSEKKFRPKHPEKGLVPFLTLKNALIVANILFYFVNIHFVSLKIRFIVATLRLNVANDYFVFANLYFDFGKIEWWISVYEDTDLRITTEKQADYVYSTFKYWVGTSLTNQTSFSDL